MAAIVWWLLNCKQVVWGVGHCHLLTTQHRQDMANVNLMVSPWLQHQPNINPTLSKHIVFAARPMVYSLATQ